jgi:hypothetical protein
MQPKDITDNQAFKGFTNHECPFLPCHPGVKREFNCLFCYCPLIAYECPGPYPDPRRRHGHHDPAPARRGRLPRRALRRLAATSRATTTCWCSPARRDRATSTAPTSPPAPTSSRPTPSTPPASPWPTTAWRTWPYEINVAGGAAGRGGRRSRGPRRPRFVAGVLGPDQPHRLDLAGRQRPRLPQRRLRRPGDAYRATRG